MMRKGRGMHMCDENRGEGCTCVMRTGEGSAHV